MQVITAKTAGFCHGVRRAVALAEQAAAEYPDNCWMLGDLIHNRHVVEDFTRRGIRKAETLTDIPDGVTVILRSHGERREVMETLEQRGIHLVDATCPRVRRIQRLSAEAEAQGRILLLIGQSGHPEVSASASWNRCTVVLDGSEALTAWLSEQPERRNLPLTMVVQTTYRAKIFEKCEKIAKKSCTNIKIYDTICHATHERQMEAAEIAALSDAMVVVGDRKSANTKHLTEICRGSCSNVIQVEDVSELSLESLKGCSVTGLTAGASTPAGILKEVYAAMSEEIKTAATEETQTVESEETTAPVETTEPSAPVETAAEPVETAEPEAAEDDGDFVKMLDKSIKTLVTGEKVTGTVTAITPTEVEVDVGAKQSAYIKLSELSDDPNARAEDIVKVGDEIEAFIIRVNDVEGYAELSKKRLDAAKVWETIENAVEDHTILEATITEVNKGGLVASVKGNRVFIPASQSGQPRGADLSTMVGQTVRLRIIEVNRARRRVVGSIKSVRDEERREARAKIWAEIEVGKRYTGTVKSMTSYGVFVDIGGVDGMVHISELSWSRIKTPSEVCQVGDTLEVYVISYDPERQKISLGVKDRNLNPWQVFMDKYQVGDTASVRIVKLMSFGAFAEVVPGVDGLIHISQIADHRIERPEDELEEGQIVDAKIIGIDEERQKISLSMRALLPGQDY